ncbi:MAG: hypothetical protein QNJ60_00250 [Xenococcaceae cyanobacterium MO_188.B19]|nr:hypothetical protein [Xenococcaceae cyanobacterium MO_188.B19]
MTNIFQKSNGSVKTGINNNTFEKVKQLEKRLEILEEARKQMFLSNSEITFTPKMAEDYEQLSRLSENLSKKIDTMLERGVNQFFLGKYSFELDKKDLLGFKLAKGKLWLPKIVLKANYKPLDCFLKSLTFSESCGWKVNCYQYNDKSPVSVWITVFPVNPEIRQINWADFDGKELWQLEQFFINIALLLPKM